MATWITHLRVAEAFKNQFSHDEYKLFLIGNIAPDSGMLNEDKLSYTPSAEISHFVKKGSPKWDSYDLEFYRKYLLNNHDMTKFEIAFKTGYFFHLLVDILWGFHIYHPCKNRYKQEFNDDPLFVWEVKKDWYGNDQDFLALNPDWNSWSIFCEAVYEKDYLDFYPQKSIQNKLQSIKDFYNTGERIDHSNDYLNADEVSRFIEISTEKIQKGMELLRTESIEGLNTLMELFDDEF